MALAVLDVQRAATFANPDSEEYRLLKEIATRKDRLKTEMDRFADLCDRFDGLYYPNDVLPHAGASHWAHHPSATTPGRSHVSVNIAPAYVDIPASLQSVEPVENFLATGLDEQNAEMAAMIERLYFGWKDEDDFELKWHQACVVKSLYGRTAAKITFDEQTKRPTVTIVDQPRNLYLGWGQSDYRRLDWALYTYRMSPESIYEEFGLQVDSGLDDAGNYVPYVLPPDIEPARSWLDNLDASIEVSDYWYRQPAKGARARIGSRVRFETWNAIFVGNVMVKNERHPEYDGKMPYVPLFNTYLPGVPDGRPELYDVEQLIREKDERMTATAQMFSKTIHQSWQLTGPEAPDVVPQGVKPIPDKVVAPGAGNRIEPISPWMPEFQIEQYMGRIDRELADVSGLNDLLRGLAPASVLSSSKAIATLIANYEARIRMKRDIAYRWRRDVWLLCADVWAAKVPLIGEVLGNAAYRLEITPPSLTPRDDMETAAMARNLVDGKLWSQARGMDRVGVDDPEGEADLIRRERTDASMFPADVQVMAQLMMVLQQMGYIAPPQAQQAMSQTGAAMSQGAQMADMRALNGGAPGSPMMNAPEEQRQLPPEEMPGNVPGSMGGGQMVAQNMLKEGEISNRIMSQQTIGE